MANENRKANATTTAIAPPRAGLARWRNKLRRVSFDVEFDFSTMVTVPVTKITTQHWDHDAERVWTRVLDQLVPLSLDCGLSIQDIEFMVRLAAAKASARRQIQAGRRLNVSGIAATTGLSRSEVAALCKPSIAKSRKQKPVDKILNAWQSDKRYWRQNGKPLDLRIYGRFPSFQSLVATYGSGIPVRAILDELLSSGDVALLSNQTLKVSNRKRETLSDLLREGSGVENLDGNQESTAIGTLPAVRRRNLKRR